jgi:ligand-binding sensor domain-containing protein
MEASAKKGDDAPLLGSSVKFSAQTQGCTGFTSFKTSNSTIPGNYVTNVAIDKDGHHWMAMRDASGAIGLCRYDGSAFTTFNTGNSSLPSDDIRAITPDPTGGIWLGTANGKLVRYNGSFTVYNLGTTAVTEIARESSGKLWISLDNSGGLVEFSGTSIIKVHKTANSGMSSNTVLSVQVDANNVKWIGYGNGSATASGISRYDGTNWTSYKASTSDLPEGNCKILEIAPNGEVWISCSGYGVARFDGTTFTVYTTGNSGLLTNGVTDILRDQSGNFWFCTIGAPVGLVKLTGSNWSTVNMGNSTIPDNEITRMVSDPSGNIWMGSKSNGLVKMCK